MRRWKDKPSQDRGKRAKCGDASRETSALECGDAPYASHTSAPLLTTASGLAYVPRRCRLRVPSLQERHRSGPMLFVVKPETILPVRLLRIEIGLCNCSGDPLVCEQTAVLLHSYR